MKVNTTWKQFWEAKFASGVSDFEADRGTGEREAAINRLAEEELREFIDPQPGDVVFDAGCGSCTNILLLHARVRRFVAVDFADAAVRRGRARLAAAGITNAELSQGDILDTQLDDRSVDKVLCLSVFHYLSDEQVRQCLRMFARILRPDGTLILHVKNLASPYAGTLQVMKRALAFVGRRKALSERFRTFSWYVRELNAAGFDVIRFNSFNLLVLEGMPAGLIAWLQKLELSQRAHFPFNTEICRRHGADLKLCARLASPNA